MFRLPKTGQAVLLGNEVPGEEQPAGSDDGVPAATRLRGTFACSAGAKAPQRRHLGGVQRCVLAGAAEPGRLGGAVVQIPPADLLHAHGTAGPTCVSGSTSRGAWRCEE